MSKKLRVSVAAFELRKYRDFGQFLSHVEEVVADAKSNKSRVLVLPELVCIGLLWLNERASNVSNSEIGAFYREVLTPLLPRFIGGMLKLAAENDIYIIGASFWHEENSFGRNSAFVFKPNGEYIRQDKIHMTRGERAINTVGGDRLVPFEIDGVKCGLFTCYDVQFPELTRHLVHNHGVEAIFIPSLTDDRGKWRVYYSGHARAIENQCFVCVSTLVGSMDIPTDYVSQLQGTPFVASPIDNRFAIDDGNISIGEDGACLISCDLDIELLHKSRERSEIRQLSDRRDDVYSKLFEV